MRGAVLLLVARPLHTILTSLPEAVEYTPSAQDPARRGVRPAQGLPGFKVPDDCCNEHRAGVDTTIGTSLPRTTRERRARPECAPGSASFARARAGRQRCFCVEAAV